MERHAERFRGGRGEVPLHPAPERAPVDHIHGHEAPAVVEGHRSAAGERLWATPSVERRRSGRRPCGCRTAPGPYQVARRSRMRATSAACLRPHDAVGLDAASPWKRRTALTVGVSNRPVASSGAVAAGLEDRLKGPTSGPSLPWLSTRSPSWAFLAPVRRGRRARGRWRRRSRRGRLSPRPGSGTQPSRMPTPRPGRDARPVVSCTLESACARLRAARPVGTCPTFPLFLALTGLADGLAQKEIALRREPAARRFAPAAGWPPLVPPLPVPGGTGTQRSAKRGMLAD